VKPGEVALEGLQVVAWDLADVVGLMAAFKRSSCRAPALGYF
jgi:hypothetical protein